MRTSFRGRGIGSETGESAPVSSKKKKHLRGKGKPPEAVAPPQAEEIVEAIAEAEAAGMEEPEADAPVADLPSEALPDSPSGPERDEPTPNTDGEGEKETEPTEPSEPRPESVEQAGAEPAAVEPSAIEAEQQLLPLVPLRAVLEAILLVSPEPVEPAKIVKSFPEFGKDEVEATLNELVSEYSNEGRGLRVKMVADGYRLETRPEFDPWLDRFFEVENEAKLSLAALETLAIIAYRQPITQPEINDIRGVNSGGVVRTLLERKLIRIHGRKAVVGSPFLYRTTRAFLEHFGLASISELPKPEEMEQLLGEGVKLPGELGQLALPSDFDLDEARIKQ